MNRAQRRALSKINKSDITAAEERIIRHQEKILNDGRAEAMFLVSILALHNEFGFGQKRCYRFMQTVDEMMGLWKDGTMDLNKARRLVENKLGIRIEM